jgi:hypothetical protein
MLVEIIVRGELPVVDPLKTLTIVGDIGARVFLYYENLELQLQRKRNTMVEHKTQLVPRVNKMEAFNQTIVTALPIVLKSVLEVWKTNLEQRLVTSDTSGHRYKWSPSATIDSLEYNWPIVSGPFRKAHQDPVYSMASIFSAMLAA